MYTFDSRIRYSEVGEDKRLTLISLVDYFQDCSTFQSEDLGIGLSYTDELGAAWILNFWQIDIDRLPALGERVVTGTQPYAFKGFIGLRNFMMETADGETLARAASVWSLMDLKNLRPVKPTDLMLEQYKIEEPFDMEYEPRKIPLPETDCSDLIRLAPVKVMPEHLDTNHHVNNARYAAFTVTAAGEAGVSMPPDRYCIEYKKQARLGDVIWPVVQKASGENGSAAEEAVTVALMDGPWPDGTEDSREGWKAADHVYAAAMFKKFKR